MEKYSEIIMKPALLALIGLIFTVNLFGTEKVNWPDSINVVPYGYVKLDAFYDSRKVVSGREGHFLLWPAPPDLDTEGNDLADKPSFNMLAVQSNFGLKVSGPIILNANSTAKIEGDFFGQKNDNINLLRLRHAFLKLSWEKTDLLVGQFWNPVFNLEAFPYTVSFTTGTPVLPFSRNPQIKLSHKTGNFKFSGIVLSQRDYPSYGPDPADPSVSIPSSHFLKNSALPEFHAKIGYKKKFDNMTLKAGAGAGYKQIMPRTVTNTGYKTDATVPGMSATAYLSLGNKKFRIATGGIYGNNATDVMSIGGFAVKGICDTTKNFYNYTTLSSGSLWADLSYNTDNFHFGVLGGYVKHLGAADPIVGMSWGLANNMAYLYRIAPRVWYQKKSFRISFEIEHTAAAFGNPDETGIVRDAQEVANSRFLLGLYYFFNK